MATLLLLLGAVLAISFLDAPVLGSGWAWDADNGLGFAAFAAVLFLSVQGTAQRNVRLHEVLGYTVLVVAVVHALWFLLFDAAAVEYLRVGAPAYMWTGLAALILLVLLVLIAMLPARFALHKSYKAFRLVHRGIAIAGVCLALHHMIASGFYLRTWYQGVLLVLLAVAVLCGPRLRGSLMPPAKLTPGGLVVISIVGAVLFTLIRNFGP